MRESDLIHKIVHFLRKVLPGAKAPPPSKERKFEAVDLGTPTPKSTAATQTEHAADKRSVTIPSTSSEVSFETPKPPAISVGGNDADDDDVDDEDADDYESVDEDVCAFGKRNFDTIASPI
jgi:hypothetical protein